MRTGSADGGHVNKPSWVTGEEEISWSELEKRNHVRRTGSAGGGHMTWPSWVTSAPRTASSLWSTKKRPCSFVVKGPMDSRNLEMLLDSLQSSIVEIHALIVDFTNQSGA